MLGATCEGHKEVDNVWSTMVYVGMLMMSRVRGLWKLARVRSEIHNDGFTFKRISEVELWLCAASTGPPRPTMRSRVRRAWGSKT